MYFMLPRPGTRFRLPDSCWAVLCRWSPLLWDVLMQPKAPGPQGLRGQQSPACNLISGLPLRLLLPHQQLPFIPQYFVSKLLVERQQCFTHSSLMTASSLLLSFAVARSLAQGLLSRKVQLQNIGSESGNREEMIEAFVF